MGNSHCLRLRGRTSRHRLCLVSRIVGLRCRHTAGISRCENQSHPPGNGHHADRSPYACDDRHDGHDHVGSLAEPLRAWTGVSGPQVMEGWHGVPFARPLQRTREVIDIVRMIARGERLTYNGELYQLPLPGGEGKALVSDAQPRPNLPIYLATLGPKNLELTGELADGWIGTSFIPEHARIFLDSLERGARKVGRSLTNLDVQVHAGSVAFSDAVEHLIPALKVPLAFYLGAMGSRKHNFYNEVFQRAGYTDLALQVQDLWLQGQRKAASALIPDELVLKTNLIGTKEMIRERLRVHQRAGVTTLSVFPTGQTLDARLNTLGQLLDLVKEVNAEN